MAEEIDDDLASFLNEDDDDLASFLNEDDDDLASFLNEESEDEGDDLASFLAESEGEEDDLAAFLNEEEEDNSNDDPLAAFFEEEETNNEDANEDPLASFFGENDTENEEEEDTGILGAILGTTSEKPEPALPYKKEKRKARADITKNSKEDHTTVKRYTKGELQEQLKRDYKFMLGKPYMVIQPVTIMADYPYKKKKNDSDIINDRNVEYDYVMVIGKVLKWRSTEEFRGKAYKLGEIMYMKRGVYWVDGKRVRMDPHFAIVLHRSYKRIKSKRIRDLLAPLKQRLRSGKPFSIYKEFPIIIERTGAYS